MFSVILFTYLKFFWPHHTACGIIVPRPGLEPIPLVVECGVLTTGPPRKSPRVILTAVVEEHRGCLVGGR